VLSGEHRLGNRPGSAEHQLGPAAVYFHASWWRRRNGQLL